MIKLDSNFRRRLETLMDHRHFCPAGLAAAMAARGFPVATARLLSAKAIRADVLDALCGVLACEAAWLARHQIPSPYWSDYRQR